MATKDTPLDRQLRKAMEAINAIAEMAELPVQVRSEALNRVCIYLQRRDEMIPPPEDMETTDEAMQDA